MDDERITLRMGTRDVQMMDVFLEEHSGLGWSRSQLIRAAVTKYIKGDAESTPSDNKASGIFVRLAPAEAAAIHLAMETGPYITEEEFIRDCLRREMAPNISEKNGNLLDAARALMP